jgi:hypothetical protein
MILPSVSLGLIAAARFWLRCLLNATSKLQLKLMFTKSSAGISNLGHSAWMPNHASSGFSDQVCLHIHVIDLCLLVMLSVQCVLYRRGMFIC